MNQSNHYTLQPTDRVKTHTGEIGTVATSNGGYCSVAWDVEFTNTKMSVSLNANLEFKNGQLQNETLIYVPK